MIRPVLAMLLFTGCARALHPSSFFIASVRNVTALGPEGPWAHIDRGDVKVLSGTEATTLWPAESTQWADAIEALGDGALLLRTTNHAERPRLWILRADTRLTALQPELLRYGRLAGAVGNELWIAAQPASGQSHALYRVSAATGVGVQVFARPEDALVFPSRAAAEDHLLATEVLPGKRSRLRLFRAEDGEPVELAGGGDEERAVALLPGGRVFYTSTAGTEYPEIWILELGSGSRRRIRGPRGDIERIRVSSDGSELLVRFVEDALDRVELLTESGVEVPLPEAEDGPIVDGDFLGPHHLVLFTGDERRPPNAYVYDRVAKTFQRVGPDTRDDAPEGAVPSEVVEFESFDGMKIPALLYRPAGASPEHRVPAIVAAHGGPTSHFEREYDPTFQYLVARGFAILAVNHRGSTGYGKSYERLDDQRHGTADLADIVHACRYLQSLPWVRDRVGVYGASYGGYLVLSALAFEPDVFAAGVDLMGVSSWNQLLAGIRRHPVLALNTAEEFGTPELHGRRWMQSSPVGKLDDLRAPLLVVQGSVDPRVQPVHSGLVVDQVARTGKPIRFIEIPGAGHSLGERWDEVTMAVADFFAANL